MRLIRIGYWLGEWAPAWPDAQSFVDADWDADERADVASYLQHGIFARAYLGYSFCRFCDQNLGYRELSYGVYLWPEGLAHYVVEHGVRLPARFVEHAAARSAVLADMGVDDRWWRGLTGWSTGGESGDPDASAEGPTEGDRRT
jgi:hypothetical protein